jgi:hypothetical protein
MTMKFCNFTEVTSTCNFKRASDITPTAPPNPEPFVQPDTRAVRLFMEKLVHDVRTILLVTGHKRKLKTAQGEAAVNAAVKAYKESQ